MSRTEREPDEKFAKIECGAFSGTLHHNMEDHRVGVARRTYKTTQTTLTSKTLLYQTKIATWKKSPMLPWIT